MITLFPDQQVIKDELYTRLAKGYKRPLIVAPTGFGKGTLAGEIIKGAVQKGKRVWFIVNRKTLVHDMSKRLKKLYIPHGIIMGAKTHGAHLEVLVTSVESLRNRLDKLKRPDLAFVDEAHMFLSKESKKLILELSEAGVKIIHMTATPWCLNRKGLGEIADTMIEGPTAHSLISTGRLAEPIVYAPSMADMEGVRKTSAGEFDEEETAQVMSTKKLVGDMVKHYRELAAGRKAVGFAVNRRTAEEYAQAFREAGTPSVMVDALTSDTARDQIWKDLAGGRVMVWSVGIISYGWDVPEVDCLILARPTMSLALHLQQCGRGLRASPGKRDCLILDHAGNSLRHGLPDDERVWTLKGRKAKDDIKLNINKLPQVCPKCSKVTPFGNPRCQCGYIFSSAYAANGGGAKKMEIDETATLQRVQSRVYIYPSTTGDMAKDALIGQAQIKNYNPGWVQHRERALDIARAQYVEYFQSQPKPHWSGAEIRSIIDNARQKSKT